MSSSAVEAHVSKRLGRAPFIGKPYPHFYVRDVWPEAYYRELLANLPTREQHAPSDKYLNRSVLKVERLESPFWTGLLDWMVRGAFPERIIRKFIENLGREFHWNVRLVRDDNGYEIGVHTDVPIKLLSLLFYLPPDDSLAAHGTSIYEPLDPSFKCAGLDWHDRSRFRKVWTAPFMPNTCFGFLKTDQSFHGVEPIDRPGIERNVLLFNAFAKP